jgi:cobalt-zinc-cadmium efflux system protein
VIVSATAAILLGWMWVEPVAVAFIICLIFKSAWGLGKPALNVLLDAVPEGIDLDVVEAEFLSIADVTVVKDLRVWSLNSQTKTLTVALYIRPGADHDRILSLAKARLKEKYGIRHATIQVETLSAR